MKIGIIIGSIREGRAGASVAQWVLDQAKDRQAEYEVVDLSTFNVPLFTDATLPAMAAGKYDVPEVQAWGDKVAEFDGFVFVTPEYNHGVPGAFKNAVDSLGVEWMKKTVGFVGYGADGGVRAVEQWRQIVANFQMIDVRQSLAINRFVEFDAQATFQPGERRVGELTVLFDQLEEITAAVSGK